VKPDEEDGSSLVFIATVSIDGVVFLCDKVRKRSYVVPNPSCICIIGRWYGLRPSPKQFSPRNYCLYKTRDFVKETKMRSAQIRGQKIGWCCLLVDPRKQIPLSGGKFTLNACRIEATLLYTTSSCVSHTHVGRKQCFNMSSSSLFNMSSAPFPIVFNDLSTKMVCFIHNSPIVEVSSIYNEVDKNMCLKRLSRLKRNIKFI